MKCKIYKNEPTAAQRKALRQECVKEFDTLLAQFNRDTALQILHILRFNYGFGQKRLEEFAEKLKAMQENQISRYELTDSDTPWLCEQQLKDSGIKLDKLIGDSQNAKDEN